MHAHALGEQISSGLVARFVSDGQRGACRSDHSLVGSDEPTQHLGPVRPVGVFSDDRQLDELSVGTRCRLAESADPLGDLVHRECELVVLLLKEQVERREHRSGDVPVVVVGLEVERVGARQEL